MATADNILKRPNGKSHTHGRATHSDVGQLHDVRKCPSPPCPPRSPSLPAPPAPPPPPPQHHNQTLDVCPLMTGTAGSSG